MGEMLVVGLRELNGAQDLMAGTDKDEEDATPNS